MARQRRCRIVSNSKAQSELRCSQDKDRQQRKQEWRRQRRQVLAARTVSRRSALWGMPAVGCAALAAACCAADRAPAARSSGADGQGGDFCAELRLKPPHRFLRSKPATASTTLFDRRNVCDWERLWLQKHIYILHFAFRLLFATLLTHSQHG